MGQNFQAALAARVQKRFYYGWVIVVAVMISNLAAFGNNSTFGLYITPLENEFGWSRAAIALGPTLATIFGALMAPVMGFLVDRFGVRPFLIGGSAMAALGFFWLGNSHSLWQFYVGYSIIWSILFPGVGLLVSNVLVTRWFVRHRSRAMGMVMMGASGSGLLFINVQSYFIETFSWRTAWMFQGGFVILLATLPALALIIENPERVGIPVRGAEKPLAGTGKPGAGQPAVEQSWTLHEALRMRAFWLTLVGGVLGSVAVSGYFAHTVPHLENLGFSRQMASAAWSVFFLVGIFAKLLWGFIAEVLTTRWSMVALYLGEATGIYILMTAAETTDLFVFAVVGGFMHGPFLQFGNQVWGDYFGRKSIGRIYGAAQPPIVLGNALGPILGGVLYDLTGNYRRFLQVLIGMALLAAALFIVNPPPKKAGQPPQP